MQDFGTKADNSPPPGGQLSAAEFNNLATENENAVSRSGQTLSGASDTQLAQSLFLHSVKSETFQDSGAANTYVVTPVSGTSGVLLPAAYTNLDGAVILFKASNANTAASTINIGQTTGTLLGTKAVVDQAGAAIAAGAIPAGRYVRARYDASIGAGSWVLISSPVVPASTAGRLSFVSATSLSFAPFNGNSITINGIQRLIPSAGVSVTNGGLNTNVTYYVYAFMSGTTMTLEVVLTGHSTDATTGVEIKTGDATRTLIGMVRTNASAQFADTPATRHVASYFNRATRNGGVFNGTNLAFSNTSAAEISSTLRVTFVTWADETVSARVTGQYIVGVSQSVSVELRMDGTAYGDDSANYENTSITGMTFSSTGNALLPAQTPLSEGFHTSTPFGSVTGTTGTVTRINHTLELRI